MPSLPLPSYDLAEIYPKTQVWKYPMLSPTPSVPAVDMSNLHFSCGVKAKCGGLERQKGPLGMQGQGAQLWEEQKQKPNT